MKKHINYGFRRAFHRAVSYFFILPVMTFLALSADNALLAQGNLMIMPRRVVFEGAKKSQELNLVNTGVDTATFVVSFVQIRMKTDGSVEQIVAPDSGQYFADKYLRIFPRQVTLGPNESQVVKVQAAKSSGMVAGEYRSHIYFRAVPKTKPLGEKAEPVDTTSMSAKLIPIFGITIPAIIRVGDCAGKVELKNLALEKVNDTLTRVNMDLNRSGCFSFFGDMKINHVSPQGKITQVALVKGLAIYTPNKTRTFSCNLEKVSGLNLKTGKLVITYMAPDDAKPMKFDEKELILK